MNPKIDLDAFESMYFTADFTLVENYESTPILPVNRVQSRISSINFNFCQYVQKINQIFYILLQQIKNLDLSLDERTDTLIETFRRVHLEDEYSILNQQLYIEFTKFVDNIETEAFKRLNQFLKKEKTSFLTYDSAIECIFDEISFETKLEELLKLYACFQRSNSVTAATGHEEISSRPEIIFIEHSFCLIKFSKLTKMISSYGDLFATFSLKLDQLASTTTSKSIQIVSKIFISLFKTDLNGMMESFKLIDHSKWNLLKNLVYFSFKFALFHMFDELNDKITRSSIGVILISIYQYIKNFNQI